MQKQKVQQLVLEADFLNDSEKIEWNDLIESANASQLAAIHDFFAKTKKAEKQKKLQIIYKAGLGDEYKQKLKSLSDNFMKQAIKKQEVHASQTNENPEDILKELDKI